MREHSKSSQTSQPDNPAAAKNVIRESMKLALSKLSLHEREVQSDAITKALMKLPEIQKASVVCCYASKAEEISTDDLLRALLIAGKKVLVPCFASEQWSLAQIKDLADLELGAFGIRQPKSSCPTSELTEDSVCIVPCIAVDERGRRLGHGGGYYDKLLASSACTSLAIAYNEQLQKDIPQEEHDVRVDAVITATKSIQVTKRNQHARVLDGTQTAARITAELHQQLKNISLQPRLVVILVGNNPASAAYVKQKKSVCEEVGIKCTVKTLPENVEQSTIANFIQECNENPQIHGILLQLPVPAHLNTELLLDAVAPDKDVDGLGATQKARLQQGDETLACCTPKGMLRILAEYGVSLQNKKIVVVGTGRLVGKPLCDLLNNRGFALTVCNSKTVDLPAAIRNADVVFSGTGVPHLIQEVKHGSVVVDAGWAKVNGKVRGDVLFSSASKKAHWITPVPGGVGPMTIAMLMENVITAAKLQARNS